MSLRYRIDSINGLDEATAALYKQDGDVYILDIDGIEVDDKMVLVSKNNQLLSESKAAKKKARDLEAELQGFRDEKAAAEEAAARKAGDFEQIEDAYKSKIQGFEQQIAEMVGKSQKATVKQTASEIAGQISDGHNSSLLAEFIQRRLKFDGDGVKVVDNEGSLSLQTLDELREEFRADERFSSLVSGSKASGSGATNQNIGAGGTAKIITRSDFNQKSPIEQANLARAGTEIID